MIHPNLKMCRPEMTKFSSWQRTGHQRHSCLFQSCDFCCTTVFLYLPFVNHYYPAQQLEVGQVYLAKSCCSHLTDFSSLKMLLQFLAPKASWASGAFVMACVCCAHLSVRPSGNFSFKILV